MMKQSICVLMLKAVLNNIKIIRQHHVTIQYFQYNISLKIYQDEKWDHGLKHNYLIYYIEMLFSKKQKN